MDLPVVVVEEEPLKPRKGRRWQGLLQRCPELLNQVVALLPWLLCLAALGPWLPEAQAGLLSALLATSLVFSSNMGGLDLKPLLLALISWPGPSDRWCRAVLKDQELCIDAALGGFSLVLLDDLLRAAWRFLAAEPSEAWPFALTCRGVYKLSQDEEWWEECYRSMAWQRLPAAPEPWPLPSPRRLVREAMLLASMMAETVGMMVLRPTAAWAAAPCIASTLLVVSCSPWLPRQSGLVLVEMSRLLSMVSKFAVYVQALLMLSAQSYLPLRQEGPALRGLELVLLAVMYSMVLCRLAAALARCRAASPLYAIPAEEVVLEPVPHNHSKPLYYGKEGVEGAFAPSRICAWEELSGISARRRYMLRRCGEILVAREAHLLSHLEALHQRTEEAEKETAPRKESFQRLHGLLLTVLCLAVASGTSYLQALTWLLLLLRFGHSWYQAVRNLTSEDEVWWMRRQLCTLHRNLAETQRLITQLEDRVQSHGAAPDRQARHCDVSALMADYIKVEVPQGAIAGSTIKFRLSDGRWLQAQIPEGYGPGDEITVEVPAAPSKKGSRFGTLHEAFQYLDPKHTGYITDHAKFAEVAEALANLQGSTDEVWKTLDQDGNGQVNWPEFVEWAEANHVELELGLGDDEGGVSFPALWTGPRDKATWVQQYDITDMDQFMELDQLVQRSYKKIWTRDRKKTGEDKVPLGYELVKATRCENLKDWKRYYFRRHQIAHACSQKSNFLERPVLTSQATGVCKRQGLRSYCNEWLLFHGTSPEAAKSILSGSGDFVISLAGSATGTLYGRGTYFAESITKADEYAKANEEGLCCVLVCKVAAGHVLYNDEVSPDAEKLQQSCISGEHHSILGDREKCRGTFKEFVIFDADQVYVEYALFYKRRYK